MMQFCAAASNTRLEILWIAVSETRANFRFPWRLTAATVAIPHDSILKIESPMQRAAVAVSLAGLASLLLAKLRKRRSGAAVESNPEDRSARKLRVLFWVQYVRGIGHLRRASVIAQHCALQGLDVTLASGGPPLPKDVIDDMCGVNLRSVCAECSALTAIHNQGAAVRLDHVCTASANTHRGTAFCSFFQAKVGSGRKDLAAA